MLPQVLLLLGAIATSTARTVSEDTETVCDALLTQYPEQVIWDPLGPNGVETLLNSSHYKTANKEYWNAKSSSNRAACTFFPSNAEEVSFAVKVLNEYPEVRYALKSGGHNPNLGFSSVDEGVLIAFRPNSQYAIPSDDGETVTVGAGAKWEDVYAVTQPLGKAAVGGRLGDIGVIGFTIGGGLSYLSAQYGLACDSVVNFECVLADGSIVNANATSNPELFFALKGGGNQYAIISRMTLKMYDIGIEGMVWGGPRVYDASKHSELLAAVANFTAHNDDPKAAIIPTFNFAGALGLNIPAGLIFFFYDGPEPSGAFAAFEEVFPLINDAKTRTYEDLTQVILAGEYEGLRFQIRENTFPNLPVTNMSSFLDDHFDMINDAAQEGTLENPLDFRLMTIAVQPLPKMIAKASHDRGENALGLDPANGDRIWVEYDIAWLSPLCDEMCPQYLEDTVTAVHDMQVKKYGDIEPTKYESGSLDFIKYNPIFMNDAMYNQDVLRSYGDATFDRLKAVSAKYDPTGFFATRQMGWGFNL